MKHKGLLDAAIKANEKECCIVDGCPFDRAGLRLKCIDHLEEESRAKKENARLSHEKRRANRPDLIAPSDEKSRRWQQIASSVVNRAVSLGILPSLSFGEYKCTDCDGVAAVYDHRDYGSPLTVDPVCKSCNAKRGTAKYPRFEMVLFTKIKDKDK